MVSFRIRWYSDCATSQVHTMRISYVEVANFRKLLAVRIDLSDETTLLVGANNSGKTSAMLALRYFLLPSGATKFCMNDFTLCHFSKLNEIGNTWKSKRQEGDASTLQAEDWMAIAPTLDLWLEVDDGELHRVSKLIPRPPRLVRRLAGEFDSGSSQKMFRLCTGTSCKR